MSPEQIEYANSFLNGVIAMGLATAGLFFLRFFKKTGDRLFALFAVAFWLLGVVRIAMLFFAELNGELSQESGFYWLRLVAYLIFLAAIIDKNMRKS